MSRHKIDLRACRNHARRVDRFVTMSIVQVLRTLKIIRLSMNLMTLKAHRIIQFGSSKRPKWTFKKHGGKTIAVPLTASMNSHNGAFLISAAEQDLGIVRVPDFLAQSSLDAGRLVQLLEPYQLNPRGIFIVYPTARYLPHRTRVLMEYLLDNVS